MNAKIHPAFWTDRELEEKPPEMKLTALWLLTNSQMNLMGITQFTPRRFSFETGLDASWLTRTLTELPRMFVLEGDKILARNFIRHQFGSGEHLVANNIGKALMKGLPGQPERLRDLVYELHPELKPFEGLRSPSKTLRDAGLKGSIPSSPPTQGGEHPEALRSPSKGKGTEQNRVLPVGECEGTRAQLEAEIDCEPDLARRRALKKRLENLSVK